MSALEIAWSVVGILAPVVVGVGFAVLSLPTAEFRAARACFGLSAFMLAGMAVFWSFQSDASTVMLWTVDGAIGIGICTFLPAGLLWISKRQHAFKEPALSPVSIDPASVRELAGAIGDAIHPPGIDRRPTMPGHVESVEARAARYYGEKQAWDMFREDGQADLRREEQNVRRRELELRKAALAEADTPDVTLEGPSEGTFVLHATGHACEIRTGPITLESAPFGFDDSEKRPVRTPHYSLEFSVFNLRDGDKEITPTLFCGEGYSRSSWSEDEGGGLAEFLRMAVMVRGGPASEKSGVDWGQPLHVSFEITFWNNEHTRQWKRRELLVYEPLTGGAFVRHAGRPELLLGPSVGAKA